MTRAQPQRPSYPLSARIAKLISVMRWIFGVLTILVTIDFVTQALRGPGMRSAWLTGVDALLCAGLCLLNVSVYRRHQRALAAQDAVRL